MSPANTLAEVAELVSRAACDLNDARDAINAKAKDPFVGKLPEPVIKAHDEMGRALLICESVEASLRKYLGDHAGGEAP